MKHLLIILSILLLSSPVIGQSSKYESVNQCVLQTMTEKKLTGNKMFEMVKEECDRILGKVETRVGERNGEKQWTRTKQLGTSGLDWGMSVTTDSSGNIYVTGRTNGGLDGNSNYGNDCSYPPCDDIFLVKYNSSGTKQWTKQLGTSLDDGGRGVTIDSSGNIYVTGSTFGGLDGNKYSGQKGGDIFLVKYNSSGTKQWTKQLGTSRYDWGSDVTTDSSGNIYVTGFTSGGSDGNTNSGDYDIFLVKYNSSGTKQWTKQFGTSSYDGGSGVTTDSSGNIYVTGSTEGGLDGNTNYGSNCKYPPCSDIFLIKYNSSGQKQ